MQKVSADPVQVIVVTGNPLPAAEREIIAQFLKAQSMVRWRWFLVGEFVPDSLAGDRRVQCVKEPALLAAQEFRPECEALLFLDQAPSHLSELALEEGVWFFRSHPRLMSAGYQVVSPTNLARWGRHNLKGYRWERGKVAFSNFTPHLEGRHLIMVLPWMEPGGADRCNLDIIQALRKWGWRVTVIATLECEHRWAHRFRGLGAEVFITPKFLSPECVGSFLHYVVKSRRSELVLLSNSRAGYEYLPSLALEGLGVPWVAFNHMEENWGGGGFPGMAVYFDALLTRHWVVSDHLRNWLVERGVESSRVDTLHWFADCEVLEPIESVRFLGRRQLGIPIDLPVILYAGRLCKQKQPDLFIDCVGKLAESGIKFLVLIAGDGDLSAHMEQRIRSLGLSDFVRMLGWLDEAEMRQAMQTADLFFLPSQAEGIALVLYEAMASGLPVVGANVGGQLELVSNECGQLIDPQEPNQIQAYSQTLARLLNSPELLRCMGEAARSRVKCLFGREQFEYQLGLLLKKALDGASSEINFKSAPSPMQGLAAMHLRWQWSWGRILSAVGRTRYKRIFSEQQWLLYLLKAACYLRALNLRTVWSRLFHSGGRV